MKNIYFGIFTIIFINGCSTSEPKPKEPYIVIGTENGKPYWYDEEKCSIRHKTEDPDIYLCADKNGTENGLVMRPMSDEAYANHLRMQQIQNQIDSDSRAQRDRELEQFNRSMQSFSNSVNQGTQNTYQMMNYMNQNKSTNCNTTYIKNNAYTNCY